MKRNFNITKHYTPIGIVSFTIQSIAKFRFIQIGRAQTIISRKIKRAELVPVELIITKL